MNINAHSAGNKPGLAIGALVVAVVVSAGLASVGVAGLIGWSTPLTIAGSVALLVGVVTSEVRASALLVDAERAIGAQNPLKAVAAVLAFMALTIANITAGHMGMTAIDGDAVNARRAPIEKRLADASADLDQANGDLVEFDAQTASQAALWARSLELVDGRFVTAGTKRLEAAQQAADERAELRKPYAAKVSAAKAKANAASAELKATAGGLPEFMLWGFAAILELLKGVSVWLATGSHKRSGVTLIAPKAVADMTDEELDEAASKAASIAAQARHEKNRRTKRAA